MAPVAGIFPSGEFRDEIARRGGAAATRCYQCATCSSVCKLAPDDGPFPRRQMLKAQWGLGDQLVNDPAVWLCHHCNDCSVRCPRDAKPGDALQAVRALAIEKLAAPAFMGRLVGKAGSTWTLLLGAPFLFWILALYAVTGLRIPAEIREYKDVVPHWLIYAVFFPVAGLVTLAIVRSGFRFWILLGANGRRSGSFVANLIPVMLEIATHKRFGSCDASSSRRPGHFAVLWGFVGAAVTSGFLVFAMYVVRSEMPLPLSHPIKVLGNLSAALLVGGGGILLYNHLVGGNRTGTSTPFDNFFLYIVLLVIATGMLAEAGRFLFPPAMSAWIYIVHLTVVLCLFITFPYSKFAHMVYRTLAMVHQRMTGPV